MTHIDEDFQDLIIGAFPYDYSPLGEYHFVIPKKNMGNWIEASKYYGWRQTGNCWNLIEENGSKVMEQSSVSSSCLPILVTGEYNWVNYRLEVEMRPLSRSGITGIMFRYQTSSSFYVFYFEENMVKLASNNLGQWKVLDLKRFNVNGDKRYKMGIKVINSHISCSLDEKPVFALNDELFNKGKCGLIANVPARYYKLGVDVLSEDKVKAASTDEIPKPVLWRKIQFAPGTGAGRSIRFGDLDGDGRLEFVLAQNMRRTMGDNFCLISYMVAYDLDGNVLWEIGEPSIKHALVTNDLPLQIYDVDGDGNNEVICIRNFEIQILDGKTGEIKRRLPAPYSKGTKRGNNDFSEDAYYRINGDSIMFCNVSGNLKPEDILIKDRYHNIWVYNKDFDLLWEASCNTGHCPCAYDIYGDGKDELLIGYTLFDEDGSKIWEIPGLKDHADGIVIGPIGLDGDIKIAIAGGDDGIMIVDTNGNILARDEIGHAQTPSVAKFFPELPDLQICTITFWRYPGAICMYNSKGKRLSTFEIYPIGSPIIPTNWTGSGQEFILFSGDVRYGGLFDGLGTRILSFPDDGHPILCCDALNLIGDERDEIVVWDTKGMYIYTQDGRFKGNKLYAPLRRPLYNDSNYKGLLSYPNYKDLSR